MFVNDYMNELVNHVKHSLTVDKEIMMGFLSHLDRWHYRDQHTEHSIVYVKMHNMLAISYPARKLCFGDSYGAQQFRFAPPKFKHRVFHNAVILGENNHYISTMIDLYGHLKCNGYELSEWIAVFRNIRKEAKQSIMTGMGNMAEAQYWNMVMKFALNSLFMLYPGVSRREIARVSSERTIAEVQSLIDNGNTPIFANVDDIAYIGDEDYKPEHFRSFDKKVVKKLAVVKGNGNSFGYADATMSYGIPNAHPRPDEILLARDAWLDAIKYFQKGN